MFEIGDIVLYVNTKEKKLKGTKPLTSFIGKLIKITDKVTTGIYTGHPVDNKNISCQIFEYELVKKSIRSHLPTWW